MKQKMRQFSCSGQIKFFIVYWKTKEGIKMVWHFSKKKLYWIIWKVRKDNDNHCWIKFIFLSFFCLKCCFFFFPKKSPPWLNMYVFHMGTKVIFWGRHLLNKNNYHAPEVHEIIFLFKMYMIFVRIQNDSTWIIIKYLKYLTYCSCLTYYSWSNYA